MADIHENKMADIQSSLWSQTNTNNVITLSRSEGSASITRVKQFRAFVLSAMLVSRKIDNIYRN